MAVVMSFVQPSPNRWRVNRRNTRRRSESGALLALGGDCFVAAHARRRAIGLATQSHIVAQQGSRYSRLSFFVLSRFVSMYGLAKQDACGQ